MCVPRTYFFLCLCPASACRLPVPGRGRTSTQHFTPREMEKTGTDAKLPVTRLWTMDSQTMYEGGRPATSAGSGPDNQERGDPAPSPHFVVDEDGRKWYPFAVPHAGGFTIDYSLDPNPVAPIDTGAPSNNPADYYVPQPRTVALSEPSRLPRPNRGSWWSGNDTRARTVPAAPARASC